MVKNGAQSKSKAPQNQPSDSNKAKRPKSIVLNALKKAVQLNRNLPGGTDKYNNLILKAIGAAAMVHNELVSRIYKAASLKDRKDGKRKIKTPDHSQETLRSLIHELESGKVNLVDCSKRIPDLALPSHVSLQIADASLGLAHHVATKGLGENIAAHGFSIVVGNAKKLMSRNRIGAAKYGEPHMSNLFEAKDMKITNWKADKRYILMAFAQDGAIVVDGISGKFVAAAYLVTDLRKGANGGGARHRSASAIANQAGGCFVIKCSQDDCEKGIAKFEIFCKRKHQEFYPPSCNHNILL
eukprot:gnl/MRDRNA2_/MRDRNA2_89344_c0_seq1.p1 gnl/MRDRNA2_/MRDRNA2_89344_c0~~gnl/MRDRNA2_/MRDRNA2_89344_c0_seq1.p1  ORF type:complete len:298 (+),score=59.25 gnl/MRDRNA2_/MRDRNA2_89344_c0_seq1:96-989(+)